MAGEHDTLRDEDLVPCGGGVHDPWAICLWAANRVACCAAVALTACPVTARTSPSSSESSKSVSSASSIAANSRLEPEVVVEGAFEEADDVVRAGVSGGVGSLRTRAVGGAGNGRIARPAGNDEDDRVGGNAPEGVFALTGGDGRGRITNVRKGGASSAAPSGVCSGSPPRATVRGGCARRDRCASTRVTAVPEGREDRSPAERVTLIAPARDIERGVADMRRGDGSVFGAGGGPKV